MRRKGPKSRPGEDPAMKRSHLAGRVKRLKRLKKLKRPKKPKGLNE